jgi:hypothetical protein
VIEEPVLTISEEQLIDFQSIQDNHGAPVRDLFFFKSYSIDTHSIDLFAFCFKDINKLKTNSRDQRSCCKKIVCAGFEKQSKKLQDSFGIF